MDGSLNLRIHPSGVHVVLIQKETKKLIIQLGTADPENALKAALKVSSDCAGIDINCGCPKRFSVISSMGSALLEDPDRLESILQTLVSNLSIPVTCKIRLIPPLNSSQSFIESTVAFAKRMERTGIAAIAVHCRFTWEKPREKGHQEIFAELQKALNIPLIANGDFYSMQDIYNMQSNVPIKEFMIARGI